MPGRPVEFALLYSKIVYFDTNTATPRYLASNIYIVKYYKISRYFDWPKKIRIMVYYVRFLLIMVTCTEYDQRLNKETFME